MKKLIVAFALLMALCLALSVAMADDLADSKSIINLMYKNKPASTPKDYELIGTIPIEDKVYEIEWTTDSDTIQVIREESGKVIIDVDENNPQEVNYVLTATVKDEAGNSASISFDRFVPAAIKLDILTEEEIVAIAYTLEDQAKLPAPTALHGVITSIPSAYSEQYGNITVNIQVGELADKPIQAYRLKGEGVADLKVGDEIAIAGVIKNYKSTIEFDAGCVLIPVEEVQSARVAMYAWGTLEAGAAMTRESTMTGVITEIPSAYSEQYGNITVNIVAAGLTDYTVQCYRLKGEGAADLKIGDVITVTGTIKNYKGTIEFDSGCQIVK
jgi:citrate lyase gamma subunit